MTKNILEEKTYLDVTYSLKTHPEGDYPNCLSKYITKTYFKRNGRLLDIGCGRGDYLDAFANLGFKVSGIDI